MAILSPKCTLKASIDHHGPVHRPAAQCVQTPLKRTSTALDFNKVSIHCGLQPVGFTLQTSSGGKRHWGIWNHPGLWHLWIWIFNSSHQNWPSHLEICFFQPPNSVPNCPGRTFQIMSVSFLHHNAHRSTLSTLHPSSQPRTPTPRRRGHRRGQRRSDGNDGSGWAWAGGRGSRGTGSPRTPRWQIYRGNGDWSHSRHEASYGLKKLGSKCCKCDSNGWMCVRNVVLVRFSVWMRNRRM